MATTTTTFGAPVPNEQVDDQPAVPVPVGGQVRVAMTARISGTRNGADWPDVGGELTLPADEAASLIRNHLAKPAPEPVERATIEPPVERAVVSRSTKRRS